MLVDIKLRILQAQYGKNFKYDLKSGKPTAVHEAISSEVGLTNRNSLSLQRAPGPPDELVRGSVRNMPFLPAGMLIKEELKGVRKVSVDFDGKCDGKGYGNKDLLTVPPGFDSGMDFPKLAVLPAEVKSANGGVSKQPVGKVEPFNHKKQDSKIVEELDIADILLPVKPPQLKSTTWAEVIDVTKPLDNFHELVPNPAFTWKFELDIFQKQAIVRLEKNESVFIAAHTSAGKTVVAEYAIALSQKHMTRTIYTSPIKALSNQKFRDFRNTFQDVGLLTGDIQLNPKATCLIMTTEILRSMLYNGSDLIRDLEWVIFDEVHYINDSERGVVWEEVLILLPEHVGIVMLSATVPNTFEFASWVGMTKKRKMYVISTPKRPVPLEHFLYTGTSGKSKDMKHLILGGDGKFLQKGYLDAVEARKPKEKVIQPPQPGGRGSDRGRGGGPNRGGGRGQDQGGRGRGSQPTRSTAAPYMHTPVWGPQQEKNLWIGVVNHLSAEDKLPVVAFTLSRNRCDTNAQMLGSVDLTTAKEKGSITQFLHKCIDKLKGSDRKLPQVTTMCGLLKRGIGVHHSGILPILKEVVEMLFQDGKVKLLFATETFAMGVNMPARTVVFDDTKKHDGKCRRTLLPAEYIQMAGRAGRRGLDTTGTVIILCKTGIPEQPELINMMLGKPQKLESQFRVTYSMILNLLRVKRLRIEDMMKRSFGELHSQTKVVEYEEKLGKLQEDVENLPKLECKACEDIEEFYNVARQYLEVRKEIFLTLSSHPQMVKELTPGRILIVSDDGHPFKVGLLLSVDTRSKERRYTVMVLSNPSRCKKSVDSERGEKLQRMLGLRERSYFLPAEPSSKVVVVKCCDVVEVTKVAVKVDAQSVLRDWDNRQIPRFSDDPPSAAYSQTESELLRVSVDPHFEMISLVDDLKLREMDLVLRCQRLEQLKSRLKAFGCYDCEAFETHFNLIFSNMEVRDEFLNMKFLTSDESLANSPEYAARLDVLKELGYVSQEGTVELKGQVACEMGNHELMVTELVFANALTDLAEEDIPALLSALVFQQRTQNEPELTSVQKEGIEKIKEIATRIGITQQKCGLKEAVGDYVDQFQYGLVEVVHKWAMGVPFYEIIELTDVQEGLIVRTIQRLDETLRDVRDAARIVGDPVLYSKMETASAKIKRDIVFQASLYLQ